MKKQLCLLAFIAMFLLPQSIWAQCTTMPTDASSLAACNLAIALEFAPEHSQEVDNDGGSSLNGRSDFLTAIDYDGDWVCNNNWDNLTQFPNSQYNAAVYYSVVWTKTHWYIVYAYYHPRDWSNSIFDPEHENDLEGILVIVRRTGENVIDLSNAVLEGGITVFHLDFYSYRAFGSSLSADNEGIDGFLFTSGGTHPRTSQEAKGHGCKAWPQIGFDEDGTVTYKSSAANNAEFPITINDSDVKYELVDIFEGGGLWSRRNNSETFASWGKFSGDNGGDNKANAPWTWDDKNDGPSYAGDMATDPVDLFDHYFNSTFPISDCYQFLPYDCDYYINRSKKYVCQNKEVTFKINRYGNIPVNNTSVNWSYNSFLWECVAGCGSNSDELTLRAKVNITSTTSISATVNTIECGSKFFTTQIFGSTDCAVAAFHFENSSGASQNVFCPDEDIYFDGTASQNETAYYIDAWRRPIGSSGNFSWYAGLGWTQGQVPTLNLTDEFAPKQFHPGYEYEIKLAVQSANTGWMPVVHRFTVLESCCKKPVNVKYDCQTAKVSWWTLGLGNTNDPDQYWIRVTWNDPECCLTTTAPTVTQWTTTNNYFYLPYIVNSNCHSIIVGSDCSDGSIQWSSKVCSNCHHIGGGGLHMKEEGVATTESAVSTEVFPNPTKGLVNLTLSAPEDLTLSVEVYNLQGQLIKQTPEQTIPDGQFKTQMSFDDALPRGLYLVYFKTNFGSFQQKLLLQ